MTTILHPKTRVQLDGISRMSVGSVIFHGPRGLGKATAARELASQLNCLGDDPALCANCRQIQSGTFPDLHIIEHAEKATIGIEQIRGLTSNLALRPYHSKGVRVVIIDDAHLLTLEAQNALLKLLEDSPPRTLIVLVTGQLEALLVTVRSRCRTVGFVRPGEAAVASLLEHTIGLKPAIAAELATASAGAPGIALTLAQHPAEAEALATLSREVGVTQSPAIFDRLLLAARLITAGANLDQFGEALHAQIITSIQSESLAAATASPRLEALETFRLALRAKVAPRVALERLMLEFA